MLKPGMSVLFVLLFLFSRSAFATTPDVCQKYAQKALDQLQQAKSMGISGLNPPVWSDNFALHFGWCLTAPDSEITKGEAERQSIIDEYKNVPPPAEQSPEPVPVPAPVPVPVPQPPPSADDILAAASALPGLVIVEQHLEGFGNATGAWVDCPPGKKGVGWGITHMKNPNMFQSLGAYPVNGGQRWRLSFGVDPAYSQGMPGDGVVENRRVYSSWLYLMCIDSPGQTPSITLPSIEEYPADCASIPLCKK